jgi:hypothetical protein
MWGCVFWWHLRFVVRASRESVRFAVLSSLPVLDDEIHAGKVLRPPSLTSRQVLVGVEVDQVPMVRDDPDGVVGPF